MSTVENFLSKVDEEAIVNAICTAELNTSGEIRVHLEKSTSLPALQRAKEVFYHLKMHQTKRQNGVLFYVAVETKTFAIYGDVGIDKKVPNHFWDNTRDIMQTHFKQGNFRQGLISAILNTGIELQQHFPWSRNDKNELPDTISKG